MAKSDPQLTQARIKAVIAKIEKRVQRENSWDYQQKQRKRWNLEQRVRLIALLMKAGFTRREAKALIDIFALKEHEHWDGRIG